MQQQSHSSATEPPECRALLEYLSTLQPSPISETTTLELLLDRCWHHLCVDSRGGMQAEKLADRMESCVWEPPLLRFTIERHGGTMCGSSRAELQHWTVNVNTLTAEYALCGHRQVRRMQPRLDIQTLVSEIAELVLQSRADPRLKWYPDGLVEIRIGRVLPETLSTKQTLEDRRRRFRQQLETILFSRGWKKRGRTYEPHEALKTVNTASESVLSF